MWRWQWRKCSGEGVLLEGFDGVSDGIVSALFECPKDAHEYRLAWVLLQSVSINSCRHIASPIRRRSFWAKAGQFFPGDLYFSVLAVRVRVSPGRIDMPLWNHGSGGK